jgi:hypothetical protein
MLLDAPIPALPRTIAPAGAAELARPAAVRMIERLTLVVFWLLVMEGALRKWVAPQFSHELFFARDPFVLLIYWYALRAGAFRNPSPFLVVGLAFAALAPLLAVVQSVSIDDQRIGTVIIYGWRQYFLYLPLPFVIARTMDQAALWRFARHTFFAIILSAPLMFLQFHSSGAAVINRGTAEDESLQFKSFDLINGLIRPGGFFTTNLGAVQLETAALALLLGAMLTTSARRGVKLPLLLLTAVAVATCLAVSGARGAFAAAALVLLSSLVAGSLVRDAGIRMRAILIPTVLLIGGAALYPILFPQAFDAIVQRAAAANDLEISTAHGGIIGRALYETVDFVDVMGAAPIAGYGLGLGGNGRSFLGQSGDNLLQGAYAESDWARHIVDLGPILGVLFIIYRVALTIELLRRTVQAAIRGSDPLPLLLFGYVGIGLFYGQLTGHGTVGGFLWLYLGVTLASCRIAMQRVADARLA